MCIVKMPCHGITKIHICNGTLMLQDSFFQGLFCAPCVAKPTGALQLIYNVFCCACNELIYDLIFAIVQFKSFSAGDMFAGFACIALMEPS